MTIYLYFQEILQQVTVLNLDTGERIALSDAESCLPKALNPLSLHIMRLTSEYVRCVQWSFSFLSSWKVFHGSMHVIWFVLSSCTFKKICVLVPYDQQIWIWISVQDLSHLRPQKKREKNLSIGWSHMVTVVFPKIDLILLLEKTVVMICDAEAFHFCLYLWCPLYVRKA